MKFQSFLALSLWVTTFVYTSDAAAVPSRNTSSNCHYLPSDAEWPSFQEWSQLNASVNGRLIAGKPLAEVCHGSNFDPIACAGLQSSWELAQPHMNDPVSVMAPYWLNNSCGPFTPRNSSCMQGNIASYTINVSSAADVAAGVKFAQQKNVRLVVKNTGHDYIGRSTGQGSLGLWTHNLKDISFVDYNSTAYQGRAVRMFAGVQAFEAYAAADANGVRIIGGFCPTVGLVGGYVQGAGHGPLASTYGLAADNTLEFEVVTTNGEHLVASPEQNSDLFWALNGGGGGAYAIVLSQVTRVHADSLVGGATLSFNNSGAPDAYWDAVSAWQTQLLTLNQNPGFQSVFTVSKASFQVNFVTWPGHTAAEVSAALAPFRAELTKRNIMFALETSTTPNYYSHFSHYTPGLPYGEYDMSEVLGGRLIPQSTVENNIAGLTAAIRNIVQDSRYTFNGFASNVSHARVGNVPGINAVIPAWRDSLYSANMVAVWDPAAPLIELDVLQLQVNDTAVPQLRALTPGGGTYVNEGTFDLDTWKEDYYGSNYERLLDVKQKYDPGSMLYGPAVVGNDYWTVAGDGRLCKA